MKANELMIGGWCRRRSIYQDTGREVVTDFQITQICKNGESLYVYGPKGNLGRVDQIEPIPLTAEILEKNFPEPTDGLTWYPEEGGFNCHTCVPDCEINAFGLFKYVHQLQHAFRLCEIEKEIIL